MISKAKNSIFWCVSGVEPMNLRIGRFCGLVVVQMPYYATYDINEFCIVFAPLFFAVLEIYHNLYMWTSHRSSVSPTLSETDQL